MKTLHQAVIDNPFPDYQDWWQVGETFTRFMSNAIVSEWEKMRDNTNTIEYVQEHVTEYISIVYERSTTPHLVQQFIQHSDPFTLWSGEFDALSYAFFRTAYDFLGANSIGAPDLLATRRRQFTQRVGRKFYQAVHDHLAIELPTTLASQEDLQQLQRGIETVGNFLVDQKYCRDSFQFSFSVDVDWKGISIHQTDDTVIDALQRDGVAYALYIMGYPVILPSAVYLYNTIGEAQHHSSRTIEQLFSRVGYDAHETDDFDPTAFPSDKVVELWEIKSTP